MVNSVTTRLQNLILFIVKYISETLNYLLFNHSMKLNYCTIALMFIIDGLELRFNLFIFFC